MKKLSIYLSILLCSIPALSAASFEIRELNFQNQQELNEVCALFQKDKEGTIEARKTLIADSKSKNSKFWICKSVQNQQICGVLHCEHAYRRANIVDFNDIFVHKNYNKKQIASMLLTHVEKFYSALGMNQIMAYRPTEYDLYKSLGFYDVPEEEGQYLYTGSERFAYGAIGLIFWPALLMRPYLVAKDLSPQPHTENSAKKRTKSKPLEKKEAIINASTDPVATTADPLPKQPAQKPSVYTTKAKPRSILAALTPSLSKGATSALFAWLAIKGADLTGSSKENSFTIAATAGALTYLMIAYNDYQNQKTEVVVEQTPTE